MLPQEIRLLRRPMPLGKTADTTDERKAARLSGVAFRFGSESTLRLRA